jgi:hypothetical protein
MLSLAIAQRIASAATVFFGRYGDVSRLARQRATPRPTLYREAHAVADALDPTRADTAVEELRHRLAAAEARCADLQQQLQQAVRIDADRQAEFAATGQALGVSLSATRTLLAVLQREQTPSLATLGRLAQAAGRRASAVLAVLDAHSRPRARQIAADEIFSGRRPVLMTIEQHSLCWLGGRLAARRDGPEWAAEFRQLPAAEQVTRDGAQGIQKGLQQVNRERQRAGGALTADQADHFHGLQRARRAVRTARQQAVRAFRPAEQAQQAFDRDGQAGVRRSPA